MINWRSQMHSVTQPSVYLRCVYLITSLAEHSYRVCLSPLSPGEPWKCHFPWFTDKNQRYTGWDLLIISASKSLHHPTAPTQFPPYHKSPPATVISVPGRGTLGRQSSLVSAQTSWAVALGAAHQWHEAERSGPSLYQGLPPWGGRGKKLFPASSVTQDLCNSGFQ